MSEIPIEDAVELLEMEGYSIPSYPKGIAIEVPETFTLKELYEMLLDIIEMAEEETPVQENADERDSEWIHIEIDGYPRKIKIKKKLTKKLLNETLKLGGYYDKIPYMGSAILSLLDWKNRLETYTCFDGFCVDSSYVIVVSFKPKEASANSIYTEEKAKKLKQNVLQYKTQSYRTTQPKIDIGFNTDVVWNPSDCMTFRSKTISTIDMRLFFVLMNEKSDKQPSIRMDEKNDDMPIEFLFEDGFGAVAPLIVEDCNYLFSIDSDELFKKVKLGKKIVPVWKLLPEISFSVIYDRYKDIFKDAGLEYQFEME